MIVIYLLFLLLLSCEKEEGRHRDIADFAEGLKEPTIPGNTIDTVDKKDLFVGVESPKFIKYASENIKSDIVYLFSPGKFTGNMGGLRGARQLCLAALKGPFAGAATSLLGFKDRPLESSIRDELGFSSDAPVYSLSQQAKLADSWQDIFVKEGSLELPKLLKSLANAGVFGSEEDDVNRYKGLFWSGLGSLATKSPYNLHNCSDWSKNQSWGRVGGNHGAVLPGKENSPIKAKFPWYDYHMTMSCDTRQNLICVAFLNGVQNN